MDIEEITAQRVGRYWHYSDGTVLPVVSGGDGEAENAFNQGVVESGSTAIDDGFVNTGAGVMTGVQPPAHPAPTGDNNPPAQQGQQQTGERMFSAAEIEAARRQERDKLYADIEKTKERNKELEKADKARKAAEADAAAQQAEQERIAAEAEMDARTLIESRTSEFQTQLAEERQRREALEAALEQERRYAQLSQYRAQVIDANRENILPELIDMINGDTVEDIDAAVVSLQQRTTSILGNVSRNVAEARQGMQGASITAPPVGPLEQQQQQQQISPEDIRNMSPQEYAQHRDRLLPALRQQAASGGIYGS